MNLDHYNPGLTCHVHFPRWSAQPDRKVEDGHTGILRREKTGESHTPAADHNKWMEVPGRSDFPDVLVLKCVISSRDLDCQRTVP